MFFKKDELSKFKFLSIPEFLFASLLLFIAVIFSFIFLPQLFRKFFPAYSSFFYSYYFGIFVFFFSGILSFLIIYYFTCVRKKKSLQDGMFFYIKPRKTILISILIGILTPLATLPVIFKFAPKEFYAMNLIGTKEGMIYLFTCALFAPVFEEIFYRGFVFPFIQSKLNSFWAVTITSLFFAFSHFMNIGEAYILLSLFIFYGFVLTLVRYFTNSLIPPVVTHFVHNVTLMSGFIIMSKF